MNRRRAAVWPDSWSNSGPRSRARRGGGGGGGGGWGPRPAMPPGIDRLCVREGQDRLLLPLPGVLYLRRDDDVTTVALDQNTLRVREALRQLELVLAPHGFFRCHRAYLVNLRRVRRIVPWSRDAQSLLLDDPKETLIPLAKSRIQELRQLLLRP